MSNKFFNLYYDPAREGYDVSSWRTLFGAPVVQGTDLQLSLSAIIHYGDILRGDAVFNINIPAPAVGHDRKFGFIQYNKDAYLYFKIDGATITAETSNGTNTNSGTITWQGEWTNTDIEFRIKWEAGRAVFYVAGNEQVVISDVTIPGDPLSLYAHNLSIGSSLLINYIDVKSIQSYILHEGYEDSNFGEIIYGVDGVDITENISIDITGPSSSLSPSASVSPSTSISASRSPSASVSPSASSSASVSPSASISASVSPSASSSASRSPSASLSPSTSISASVSPSASISASVSPSASYSPSASVSPSPQQ